MGFKRKRVYAKKPKKRSFKKRRIQRTGPPRGLMSRSTHSYARYGTPETVSIAAGGQLSSYARVFTFNDIRSYTEFTNLYDQYKITRVVMMFQLVDNPDQCQGYVTGSNTGTVTGATMYPRLWYLRDYDDDATLNPNQMQESAKSKMVVLRPNKITRIAIKPAVKSSIYRTAVSEGFAPKWNQKLDMAAHDIPHYCLKYALDSMTSTATAYRVKVDIKYYFTCYNTR